MEPVKTEMINQREMVGRVSMRRGGTSAGADHNSMRERRPPGANNNTGKPLPPI
jgi:hypothetical protein